MNEKMMNMIATAAVEYADKRLRGMVEEYMPDGKFINLHNDQIDHCDMILMLMSGDIVPIDFGVHQCMNPLRVHKEKVYLSTFSLGARHFECQRVELIDYIEEYNLKQLEVDPRYVIIGWHLFDEEV